MHRLYFINMQHEVKLNTSIKGDELLSKRSISILNPKNKFIFQSIFISSVFRYPLTSGLRTSSRWIHSFRSLLGDTILAFSDLSKIRKLICNKVIYKMVDSFLNNNWSNDTYYNLNSGKSKEESTMLSKVCTSFNQCLLQI